MISVADGAAPPGVVGAALRSSRPAEDMDAPAPDMTKVNAAILGALKPGGVFLVIDHTAAAGST